MHVRNSTPQTRVPAQCVSLRRRRLRPHWRCPLASAAVQLDRLSLDESLRQSDDRNEWQSAIRTLTGRRKHRVWQPQIEEPLLGAVTVVLVAPRKPISVGTVARALSCFECLDLRLVQPRCDHLSRSSRNGSKGAQFLLWGATVHDSLESALQGADFTVACTRWVQGRQQAYRSIDELLASPRMAGLLDASSSSSSSSSGAISSSSSSSSGAESQQPQPGQAAPPGRRLALVFGREVEGLAAEEVDACDATLSIPIGRLQESLSLSHAVSIVLSRLFEARQARGGYAAPRELADLAPGFEETGVER